MMVLIMKTVKFRAAWFRPYSRVIWGEIYIEPNVGKYPQNRRVCEYKKMIADSGHTRSEILEEEITVGV